MHFDILVEDISGKRMLDELVPKIIGANHTFTVHSYKGIGRLPKGMTANSAPGKRILLDQLPKILQGFGKTHAGFPVDYPAAVFVICDLDDRCLAVFRAELQALLQRCNPTPETQFCVAIEEGEAWLLGDLCAVRAAYPRARINFLNAYNSDSICGTWEVLANALVSGGESALKSKGWKAVGKEKSEWAEAISPHMNVEENNSPSFCYFRDKLRLLANP